MSDSFEIDHRWERAPVYLGPGTGELREASRVVMLDFCALEMLADYQVRAGAFKASDVDETETAPVIIGNLPGAFIKISSEMDKEQVYTPREPEILVVINGLLTIRNQRFSPFGLTDAETSGALASGDVMTLEPESVQMTAQGPFGLHAESLALTIMDVARDQRDFISIQNGLNRG